MQKDNATRSEAQGLLQKLKNICVVRLAKVPTEMFPHFYFFIFNF